MADNTGWLCEICNHNTGFTWGIVHGHGNCHTCESPYKILHYENNKPVNKPFELLIKPQYIDKLKEWWRSQASPDVEGLWKYADTIPEESEDAK